MKPLTSRSEIRTVLADILLGHPEGLSPSQVYDYFRNNYSYPKKLDEAVSKLSKDAFQKKFGHVGRRSVPQQQVKAAGHEPIYQNDFRWARNSLKPYLVDQKGLWKVKATARRSLADVANANRPSRPTIRKKHNTPPAPLQSERDLLLQKILASGQKMSIENLRILAKVAEVFA